MPDRQSGPCQGGPVEAVFHTLDAWTGMCGCGAGPFIVAEHRRHYLDAAAAHGGCTTCDLDDEAAQPARAQQPDLSGGAA